MSTPESFERDLAALTGHPEGDMEAWLRRYEPLIEEVLTLQERDPGELLVSVIVVAWRASKGVARALERLGSQQDISRAQMQVILVDNSAPEGLGAISQAIAGHVDLHVRMRGNVGASPGRNAGACFAMAPVLAFIDDDGLIARDFMAKGLHHFEQDPDLLGLRGRVTALEHPYFTTLAGHYDRGTQPVKDCLITEGCAMVRREVFMRAGGFADRMFGHEGIELTYRIERAYPEGHTLYVPDVVMQHDYFDTWHKFWVKNTRYSAIDTARATRPRELQDYMDAYFATRYTRSPMPPDEQIARLVLGLLRALVRRAAAR